MCTPSFDVKILVEKVRITLGIYGTNSSAFGCRLKLPITCLVFFFFFFFAPKDFFGAEQVTGHFEHQT